MFWLRNKKNNFLLKKMINSCIFSAAKGDASQGIPEEDPGSLSPSRIPAEAWSGDIGVSSNKAYKEIVSYDVVS